MRTRANTPEGVSQDAWDRIARRTADRYEIDERNPEGEIIGVAYRHRDGSKSFRPGGKRGLIVPWPLDLYAGSSKNAPVFVCEGASDTAAMLTLGLDAVGVPMTGQGGDMLAVLLKDRHAVIVADNDNPGRTGANQIAEQLTLSCKSVRIIEPAKGAKDARESVIEGAKVGDYVELMTKAAFFEAPVRKTGARATEPNEFEWVSISELGPAEEIQWLWPGYTARGAITLMTGQWKAGKTTLVMHLLRDMYRGEGLVDTPVDAPTLVVSEEGSGLWSTRREQLGLDERIMLLKRDSFRRLNINQWIDMIDSITDHAKQTNAAMVVLDTIAGIWPVASENDAAEVAEALAPLRDITQTGASLLLIHHPRKSDATNFNASRGSGALPSFADILIEMRRYSTNNPEDTRRVLKAAGRYEGIPAELVIDKTDDGFSTLGAQPVVARADELDTIWQILLRSESGASRDAIREAWPEDTISERRLLALLNEGLCRGRWTRRGAGVRGDPHIYTAQSQAKAS